MGKVKNWLMEMEEYAFDCIETAQSTGRVVDSARHQFLLKYPNQERVFEDVLAEYKSYFDLVL